MTALGHSVRRHTLEVRVSSEARALALQPRLSDFDARTVVPALSRVLDELDGEVQYARLGRIEVDLGTLPAEELETAGAERLLPELRRALGAALREAAAHPSPGRHLISVAAARRQLLEHYLLHGTLPFWGPHPSRFALGDLLRALADDDPRALVASVRDLSDRPQVLERIAAQAGEPLLELWIALLEPRHARLIVAYVRDLRGVHRAVRLVALGDEEFAETLWVLTQAYLLRDPGSQFNRKSFLRSLLQGLAGRRGVDYAALLATLERGLARMGRRRAWHASLPGVVGALVREASLVPPGASVRPRGADLSGDAAFVARLVRAPGLRRVLAAAAGRRALLGLEAALASGRRLTPRLLASVLRLLSRARALSIEGVRTFVSSEQARGRLSTAQAALAEAALDRLARGGRAAPVRPARRRPPVPTPDVLLALLQGTPSAAPSGRRGAAPSAAAGKAAPPHASPDAEPTDGLASLARRGLEDPIRREEWARTLSDATLEGLVEALEPARHRDLIEAVEVLAAAWRGVLPPGQKGLAGRTLRWTFVLDFLARTPAEGRTVERLAAAFCAFFAARYQAAAAGAGGGEDLGVLLLARADRLARSAGNAVLVAVLERGRRRLREPWEGAGADARSERSASLRPPGDPSREARRASDPAVEEADDRDAVSVENAGLVLVGPFLPHLLQTLQLLGEGPDGAPRLRDRAAATRAVHLLQYLVDGRPCAPEPALALNKVLLGLEPATPVGREVELEERERVLAEQLLRALLARWTVLGGTSVAGLRETFLQREGRLRRGRDGFRLRVQRRTVDVLVDQVPWSVSVVLHPWMPCPVYVTW